MFEDEYSRDKHVVKKHWGCSICLAAGLATMKPFKSFEELRTHAVMHHYACTACDAIRLFGGKESLSDHQHDEHHPCFRCNNKGLPECFKCKRELYFHTLVAHQACPFCKAIFTNVFDIERHNVKNHFVCSECHIGPLYEVFATEKARNDHCKANQHEQKDKFVEHMIKNNGGFSESKFETAWKSWTTGTHDRSMPKSEGLQSPRSPSPTQPPLITFEKSVIDVYAVLKVSSRIPQADVLQAVEKRRRIVHPDKMKRMEMSEDVEARIYEVAKLVEFAADITLDPKKRAEQDQKFIAYRWKVHEQYDCVG